MNHPRAPRRSLVAVVLAIAVAAPAVAAAQTQPQEPRRTPDFLFGRPHAAIGIRGSWTFASAGSDLFDFVTRELTIDKSDFNGPGFGGDLAVFLTSRVDAQFGFFITRASQASEYRDLVDNNFLPIEQFTSLKTLHLTGSLRYALAPRGRDVSRFAWVPSGIVPFVGGGGGVLRYDLLQRGDFVDFQDSSVFSDVFRSNGWTASVHAFGGVDIKLFRGLYGTMEGRYTKAAATLSEDFVDFDPIDLSGFRLSAGINLVF
jgi:opacity protein-like surface antigen